MNENKRAQVVKSHYSAGCGRSWGSVEVSAGPVYTPVSNLTSAVSCPGLPTLPGAGIEGGVPLLIDLDT